MKSPEFLEETVMSVICWRIGMMDCWNTGIPLGKTPSSPHNQRVTRILPMKSGNYKRVVCLFPFLPDQDDGACDEDG